MLHESKKPCRYYNVIASVHWVRRNVDVQKASKMFVWVISTFICKTVKLGHINTWFD